MARSQYIYQAQLDGRPVAAFTVKHEMLTWLRALNPTYVERLGLWRLTDNMITTPVELELGTLLEGKKQR